MAGGSPQTWPDTFPCIWMAVNSEPHNWSKSRECIFRVLHINGMAISYPSLQGSGTIAGDGAERFLRARSWRGPEKNCFFFFFFHTADMTRPLHPWIQNSCSCLPVIKPVSIPAWSREALVSPNPSRGATDSWWLLAEKRESVLRVWPTVDCPHSSGWATLSSSCEPQILFCRLFSKKEKQKEKEIWSWNRQELAGHYDKKPNIFVYKVSKELTEIL